MVKRTSNKGKVIDFDSLIAQNQDEPAMGNMKVLSLIHISEPTRPY